MGAQDQIRTDDPAIFSPRQTVYARLISSIPCLNQLFLFRGRLPDSWLSIGLAVDLAVWPRKSATNGVPRERAAGARDDGDTQRERTQIHDPADIPPLYEPPEEVVR